VGLMRESAGGYAERVAVPEEWLFDLPEGASFEEGAAFPIAFLTAWIPLTRQASVRPGARVLVHAAAGGVGSAAVQVARALGAEVVATAGSEEKLELPRGLGASEAVTYERVAELEPVDVVFDPVGGRLFADSLKLLQPLGVAIAIGFAAGPWEAVDPALLVGRNIGVQGFYFGRFLKHRPDAARAAAADVFRLWSAGLLKPVVGASFPLADGADAHRLIEERRSTGKVVLVP
jgi:NADPH:quinone reductase